jgi:hypothetical protein
MKTEVISGYIANMPHVRRALAAARRNEQSPMKKKYDNFGHDEPVLGPLLTPEISAVLKRNPGFAYFVERPFGRVLHFRIARFNERIDFAIDLKTVEAATMDLIAASLERCVRTLAESQQNASP